MTRLLLFVIFSSMLPLSARAKPKPKSVSTAASIYKEVKRSVVTVKTGGTQENIGAGVMVHRGFVVAAAHVVEEAQSIRVEFSFGAQVKADVVTLSRTEDVALLKLRKTPAMAKSAPLGDSAKLSVGDDVISVGAPLGLSFSLSKGIVSAIRNDYGTELSFLPRKVIQVDAAINQGNSGGAIFNTKGEVVGIASFIINRNGGGSVGLGFAVPSNVVKRRLFKSAIPFVGLSLRRVPKKVAEVLHWPKANLLLVERVLPGSAAADAGFRGGQIETDMAGVKLVLGGDLILKVNGINADEGHRVHAYLQKLKGGDVVKYDIVRRGQPMTLKMKVPKLIKAPTLR